MYHRGTLEQFNIWHTAAKLAYGIPPDGIVGFVNNSPAPANERTTGYVNAIQSPNGSNDYIWEYGAYPDSKLQVVINNPWSDDEGY